MVRFVPVSQPDDHDAGPASSPRRPQQHRRQRVTYLRPIAAPEPMGLSIEPHSDNILAVRVGSVDWTALDRCRNSATSTCLTHYPTHNEGSVAVIDPAVQAKLFWLPLGKVYASNRPAEISANGITIGYRLTSKPVATTTTLASSPSVNGCSPIFLQITDIWCASGSLMTSRMGLHPSAPVSAGGDLASPTSPFSPKLYTSGIRSESFGSLNDQAGFEIMPRRSTLLLVDTSAGTTEPDCSDVCIDARSGSSAYSPRSSVATAYSAFSEASLAVSQPGSRWNPERIECSSWWGTV
ncbi:uncharacterized protein BJ171DRAFT_507405 [Polychytrium aggregatum]|uniref:uncharacterized protein n=1 Tax=Polychytrium aggregatum TaxID=110093 RepID=UPI0022FE331A|nr:uncharacterized protein BJ171DRAFT_507405 [Polychytrium aggregatum]KAI9204024.1 hypothetical protein BJ171DRAFT_507405 [Polychytrium aggregatum]